MSLKKTTEVVIFSISAVFLLGAGERLVASVKEYLEARSDWNEMVQWAAESNMDTRGVYSQLAQLDDMTLRLIALGEVEACSEVTCGPIPEASAKAMASDAMSYKQSLEAKGNNTWSLLISALAMLAAIYAIFHPQVIAALQRRRPNPR